MLLAALGLGLAVGAVLGALGGGGSVLTVPLLVFALGVGATQATTASLVIVGVTAAVASVGHARAGRTRWTEGALLTLAGAPAAWGATQLNRLVSERTLLLAFSGLLLVAAAGMLLRRRDGPDDQEQERDGGTDPSRGRPGPGRLLRLAGAGVLVGALTGFFGVGGGFVVVPVLVAALGYPVAVAVGTSLLVIALNSGVALLARWGSEVPWGVVLPFTAAAVLASLAAARVSGRLPERTLTRAFGVLLLLVAGYVAVRAVVGLP